MGGLVPDVVMIFKLNGERKQLSYRKLPFSTWSELKAQLRFTPRTLMEAAEMYDLEAFGAIIWLERKQTERALAWVVVRRELENAEVDLEMVNLIIDGVGMVTDETEAESDPTPASS